MAYFGADPGGGRRFGLARLDADGRFATWCVESVGAALERIVAPLAIGIDAPLWWSAGSGGGRAADAWLRRRYRLSGGQVQSVNSLRGAAIVQGPLLAARLRQRAPGIMVTESHPKALLAALGLQGWPAIAARFGLRGGAPDTEDERDALLGAVAAREGHLGRWTRDLAAGFDAREELDPATIWWGPVHYWWPAEDELQPGEGATSSSP